MAYKTASQIAGLFLEQALQRLQRTDDDHAKHNYREYGWLSMYLSPKQEQWISQQYNREFDRKQSVDMTIVIEGNPAGIWATSPVGNCCQIRFTLKEAFVQKHPIAN